MPLSFPTSPSPTVGQTSTQNGRSYTYAGNNVWELTPAAGGGEDARWDYFKPAAPTSVTAASGNGQASVSWTAPTAPAVAISDYAVQFSSNSGSTWTTFSDGTSTSTSATVTGLTNGTAYTFRVAAVNGIGQGPWSTASDSATPSSNPISSTANLFGWWDASDTATLFSDTAGTTLATSGNVLRWADKSGNGNHAIVSSASTPKPQFTAAARNSLTALLFNQYGAGYSLGDKLPLTATGATIIAAVKIAGLGSGGYPTIIAKSQVGSLYGWGVTPNLVFWRANSYAQTSWSATDDAWAVMSVTIPSGNWPATSVFINGTQASQSLYNDGISAPPSTNADLTIGRNEASENGWRSYIGELAVFDAELTSTQRSTVASYMMTKWGIT